VYGYFSIDILISVVWWWCSAAWQVNRLWIKSVEILAHETSGEVAAAIGRWTDDGWWC